MNNLLSAVDMEAPSLTAKLCKFSSSWAIFATWPSLFLQILHLPLIDNGPLINYLLSAVDMAIDKLPTISTRYGALINYLLSAVDMGIDKLPAIRSRYRALMNYLQSAVDMGH